MACIGALDYRFSSAASSPSTVAVVLLLCSYLRSPSTFELCMLSLVSSRIESAPLLATLSNIMSLQDVQSWESQRTACKLLCV